MSTPSKKNEILTIAAHLYAEKGYDTISMRDVAAAVGVAPASLYHHFSDKEHLYREALVLVFSRLEDVLAKISATQGEQAQRVEALVRGLMGYLFEDAVFTRLLLRELNEGQPERLAYLTSAVFSDLYTTISRILPSGATQEVIVQRTDSLICLMLGYVQLHKVILLMGKTTSQQPDVEDIIHRILKIFRQQMHEEQS